MAGSWLRIQLKHYTGAEMIRRAFAFIVAVLVIAAPVAAQMCGAACSERLGHASHSGQLRRIIRTTPPISRINPQSALSARR